MVMNAPTKTMVAVQRHVERKRADDRLRARANPEASYEESRALRNQITAGRDETDRAQTALAEQMLAIVRRGVGRAYGLLACRCEDEEDAKRRIRGDVSDRSRMRLPLYTLFFDSAKAWEGAFENGTIAEHEAHWLERWFSYASPDLPRCARWMAEPVTTLKQVDGIYVAACLRGDVTTSGEGATDDAAVAAMYVKLDAPSAAWRSPETEQ